MGQPKTPDEKEAYLKQNASLVWNVGTILEDRRDHVEADVARIWDHLYENLDSIYEQIGPTIDRTEDLIFGDFPAAEPEEEEGSYGIPYSKLQAFEKIVITYSGSNDEGYVDEIVPEPPVDGMDISYDLHRELEDAAYEILNTRWGGWEINEGSQGHITITVADRKVFVHHGTNREETDWEDVVV